MRMFRDSGVLLLALALTACGGSRPYGALPTATGPSSNIEAVAGGPLPVPSAVDSATQFRQYLVGPLDELNIGVHGIEEFAPRDYTVDAAGRLSFPLIGSVEVSGKTLAALEQEIAGRLRTAYVRNPQVSVNLKEANSQIVTVSGQVKQPGLYPVVGRMTLMQAIARAQGLDEFAKRDEVVIFREVGDQRFAGIYNLAAIEHGNYADPEVYPRDIVVVGDSVQRRALRDAIGAAPAILAPLLVTLTNGN